MSADLACLTALSAGAAFGGDVGALLPDRCGTATDSTVMVVLLGTAIVSVVTAILHQAFQVGQ